MNARVDDDGHRGQVKILGMLMAEIYHFIMASRSVRLPPVSYSWIGWSSADYHTSLLLKRPIPVGGFPPVI